MKKNMTAETIQQVSEVLKAMADPMRLRILHSLHDGELSVTGIIEAVGGSQANVSRHLAVLRNAGLVENRREGLNAFYRISDPRVFTICESVCSSIGERLDRNLEQVQAAVAARETN
jgi:DNA-binding transcriptional ArsR family regulator